MHGRRRAPGGRLLHDIAEVHDRYPVAHGSHRAEVVGDEEVHQAQLGSETVQQREDLDACQRVQRGGRLIKDEQRWRRDQCARDTDALLLPATELVGVIA